MRCAGLNRAGDPHVRYSLQAIPGSDNDMPGVSLARILHTAENKKEKREKRKRGRGSAFSGRYGRRGVTGSLASPLFILHSQFFISSLRGSDIHCSQRILCGLCFANGRFLRAPRGFLTQLPATPIYTVSVLNWLFATRY